MLSTRVVRKLTRAAAILVGSDGDFLLSANATQESRQLIGQATRAFSRGNPDLPWKQSFDVLLEAIQNLDYEGLKARGIYTI